MYVYIYIYVCIYNMKMPLASPPPRFFPLFKNDFLSSNAGRVGGSCCCAMTANSLLSRYLLRPHTLVA